MSSWLSSTGPSGPAAGSVNTTLNPLAYVARAHVIFLSRGSRLESSRQESQCLSQNSHSSQRAQHVARALVVVSFTLEHNLTFHSFHLHSSPTFHSSTFQNSTDVTFTQGIFPAPIHRMCLSVLWLKRTRLHDAQLSSLAPYTFSGTDTQSDDCSFAALSFNEFNRCHCAKRVPVWPPGRTKPSQIFT